MSLKVLYHGTDIISARNIFESKIVNVDCGIGSADFGKGFYTTDDRIQAEQWARHKAEVRSSSPAIVKMYFDKKAAEPIIERFDDDLRWGRFIINNRNGYDYINRIPFKEHNLDRRYQITIGRIADVRVLSVVKQLYLENKMLDSLSEILNPEYPLQIVFHTQFATTFIKKISYQNV